MTTALERRSARLCPAVTSPNEQLGSGRDQEPLIEPALAAEMAVLLGAEPVGESA
jgi:hypothetical protein